MVQISNDKNPVLCDPKQMVALTKAAHTINVCSNSITALRYSNTSRFCV